MSQDDEAARKMRAQKLRAQISKLTKPADAGAENESDSSEEPESEPQHSKSPREFIEDRMRELDKENEP